MRSKIRLIVVGVSMAVASLGASNCGGDSPTESPAGLAGTWQGSLINADSTIAATVRAVIAPDGQGAFGGSATVTSSAVGQSTPISYSDLVAVDRADSVTAVVAGGGPQFSFRGRLSGNTLAGVLSGALVGPIVFQKQ
jgi:hypothetical protein